MLVDVNVQALADKRKALGYSRTQLSQKAGLADNAVYRMECAAYRVSHLRLKAVADVLGCPVEELKIQMEVTA